jgi:acylaminoacyl-peptidase
MLDWCHVEAGGPMSYNFEKFKQASPESIKAMHAASPIVFVDKVKTPTLMLLGAKDRRVPYSQGLEYYHILRSNGVKAKILVFPEDTHAIDKPLSECEQWLAVSSWFQDHVIVGPLVSRLGLSAVEFSS